MSDTQPVTPEVPAASEPPAAVEPAVDPAPAAPADPWAALPEEFAWARTEVETTRREAANYRTQLRETQDKLSQAKTPEEVAAITADGETRIAALERTATVERLARAHNLNDMQIEFLTAVSEDELKAQAEKLVALAAPAAPAVVQVTKVPLSGGLQPGSGGDSANGRDAWRKFRERNR